MQLHGIHHVTAVMRNASRNLRFYTQVLGLRLVKKTVNQDDVSAYHLFYADKLGTPGTDMTFFDWPQTPPDVRGTDSIVNTLFRVDGQAALAYWMERLAAHDVTHHGIETFDGRLRVRFYDPEGQRLTLVDDGARRSRASCGTVLACRPHWASAASSGWRCRCRRWSGAPDLRAVDGDARGAALRTPRARRPDDRDL